MSTWIIANPSHHRNIDQWRSSIDHAATIAGLPKLSWLFTTLDDPGDQATHYALSQGATHIIVAGGDGTVRTVGAALAHTGVRMTILPTGTGNVCARNLHIPLHSYVEALRLGTLPSTVTMDLCWLSMNEDEACENISNTPTEQQVKNQQTHEHPFLIIAGIGYDAETMHRTTVRLKKHFGWSAYILAALRSITAQRFNAHIHWTPPVHKNSQNSGAHSNGQPRTRHTKVTGNTVMFVNCGRLPLATISPDSSHEDGRFEIVVANATMGVIGWATLGAKFLSHTLKMRPKNIHKDPGTLHYTHAETAKLTTDRARLVHVDGDTIGRTRAVTIKVDHGAVLISAPDTTAHS